MTNLPDGAEMKEYGGVRVGDHVHIRSRPRRPFRTLDEVAQPGDAVGIHPLNQPEH